LQPATEAASEGREPPEAFDVAPTNLTPHWPAWRGVNRDAIVPTLPDRLADKPTVVWRTTLTDRGIGGVAATSKYVLVSDRELDDQFDVFRCLDAATGREIWTHRYPAPGLLDYGNSPRATPLVAGERCFTFGAHGHLSGLELATGRPLWQLDVKAEFGLVAEMKWGLCGSPLLADGKLIVSPGGPQAAIVALDPATGKLLWKSPGNPPGYGSFIVATLGGRRQVVGHDATTLGGWDLATGKRLWTLEPPNPGDFNVPTPLVWQGHLIVATENNGTRMFRFGPDGVIVQQPVAAYEPLSPDTHSPVVSGDRLLGIMNGLHCLDLKNGLKALWIAKDPAYLEHASLITAPGRLLVISGQAELILLDVTGSSPKVVGRQTALHGESGLLSHPALAGTRLYLRGTSEIVCLDLAPNPKAGEHGNAPAGTERD
jgi:outer membrane protein assembly factor BamB